MGMSTNQWNYRSKPAPLVVPLADGFTMCGFGRSTGYKMVENDPDFPKPIECSAGRKGFIVSELQAWVARRAAARDEAA
jgi:predicted DNA-binding transcriptional regulator AlpA